MNKDVKDILNQRRKLMVLEYHSYIRLKALKSMQRQSEDFDIYAVVIDIKDDRHLKELMYSSNSRHGTPLSKEAKKKYAKELILFDKKTSKEIGNILGVSR
jgi:hypothetical protein